MQWGAHAVGTSSLEVCVWIKGKHESKIEHDFVKALVEGSFVV